MSTDIRSPILQSEWSEFSKSNPDVTEVLRWISKNVSHEKITDFMRNEKDYGYA